MTEPATATPRISDPDFRHAVELIDAGDAAELRSWVSGRPALLSATANEDGSNTGAYFAKPRLIWFVAENPVRNGTLPQSICQVTQALIDVSEAHQLADRIEQLGYTLALVSSGRVARECGVQNQMIKTLVRGGANPNAGIQAAITHRETDACRAMLEQGAELTIALATGLGMVAETERLVATSTPSEKQLALSMAAINTQPKCLRILLEHGADPNQFNPDGAHSHTTPLHQAVFYGDLETVQILIEFGADRSIRDKSHHGDAKGWAIHAEQESIAAWLNS